MFTVMVKSLHVLLFEADAQWILWRRFVLLWISLFLLLKDPSGLLQMGFWSALNRLAVRGSTGAWEHGVDHKGGFSKALCSISEGISKHHPLRNNGWMTEAQLFQQMSLVLDERPDDKRPSARRLLWKSSVWSVTKFRGWLTHTHTHGLLPRYCDKCSFFYGGSTCRPNRRGKLNLSVMVNCRRSVPCPTFTLQN